MIKDGDFVIIRLDMIVGKIYGLTLYERMAEFRGHLGIAKQEEHSGYYIFNNIDYVWSKKMLIKVNTNKK